MLGGHRYGRGDTDTIETDTAMVLLAGILRAEIIGTEPRTNTLPVAEVIDAWLTSEEGPCIRCGVRTCIYGPRGRPLCADCRPSETGATVIPVPAARVSYDRGQALAG
jgi:hypothetical protein